MKQHEKDEKFLRVLFSDLLLAKLKPLLISRNNAKINAAPKKAL